MMLADGVLRIYTLQNTASQGAMPVEQLVSTDNRDHFYADRVVGFSRQYAAKGVDQRIDKLVRIWATPIEIGAYVILDDADQYRVDMVQSLRDDEGLKVVDLTLSKLEANYDVATE
jgi:hypothetical protein